MSKPGLSLPTNITAAQPDPTDGISADIAPQFLSVAPHACTTPTRVPPILVTVPGQEAVLARRPSSPRHRTPRYTGPERHFASNDGLGAERSKYGE
jgi:hypothetical protein